MPYQLISLTFFVETNLNKRMSELSKLLLVRESANFFRHAIEVKPLIGAFRFALSVYTYSLSVWFEEQIRSLALAFKGEWDVRSYSDAEWALKLRRTGDKGKHTRNNVENTYLPNLISYDENRSILSDFLLIYMAPLEVRKHTLVSSADIPA